MSKASQHLWRFKCKVGTVAGGGGEQVGRLGFSFRKAVHKWRYLRISIAASSSAKAVQGAKHVWDLAATTTIHSGPAFHNSPSAGVCVCVLRVVTMQRAAEREG